MSIFDVKGKKVLETDYPSFDLWYPFRRHFNTTEGSGTTGQYGHNNNFVIAHLSDIHNDSVRYKRFLEFVNKNKQHIDCAVVTGDIVDAPDPSLFSSMLSQEAGYDFDLLKVVGNHEKSYADVGPVTNAFIYTSLGMNTNTGLTYYYKDYPEKKIRVVVLNSYANDSAPTKRHYTQAQITFLINALQGAIENNYNVLIGMHDSEGDFPTPNDSGFYQRWSQSMPDGKQSSANLDGEQPIADIINAFKHGTSINKTYTYNDGGETLTVNTTFTTAGSFVAYMHGHYHIDRIGYSKKYSDQLYLDISIGCLQSDYRVINWVDRIDTPRIVGDKSEDLFNLYAIDIENKVVKVARVGADMNDLLEERKLAIFTF